MASPQDSLRAWLPHLLMLALLALAIWLLAAVFKPIREPILLAAALSALTYAVLFEPIHHVCRRWLPFLDDAWSRAVAAFVATASLLIVIVSPLIFLLLTSLRSVSESFAVFFGIIRHDPRRIDQVLDLATEKMVAMHQL
jgi:predicted PurR-regulated permease PerM